jgi:hypothetical protein
MSEISVGSAIGAGFSLIGRKPLTVLAWGLVRVGFVALLAAIYAPAMLGMFSAMASFGPTPPPDAFSQAILPHLLVMQGAGALAQIGGLLVGAITFCAVARAVVRPGAGAFAYLRLGAPELFLALLLFGAGFALFFAIVILAVPVGIGAVMLFASHQYAAMAALIALAVIVLILVLFYVALRFAFVVPMMVDDGQFHLFDAWTLSKGRVGSLIVIAIAAETLLGGLSFGLFLAAIGVAAGGLAGLPTLFQQNPAPILARLMPWAIAYGVLLIPVQGCGLAIFVAPWAQAYRDIAPPPSAEPAPAPVAPSPAPA